MVRRVGGTQRPQALTASTPPSPLPSSRSININDTEDPSTGLPIATESGVTLEFTGLPPGAALPANATVTLLDSAHGWAKPTWLAAGSPTYPTPAQIEAELAASAPATIYVPVSTAGGTATVVLPDLLPYAVMHVVVEYAL